MVDKNELRAAFSSRLHEALDDAGIRSRGRGVDIQKQLKSVGVNKTTQAISKWLNAEAMAEADSMVALAAWLRVRREWLEYGVLPKSTGDCSVSDHTPDDPEAISSRALSGKVPLISWAEAWMRCDGISHSKPEHTHQLVSCPIPISRSGYALKVMGDSMTNPGAGRSYPAGCIIFVDPEVEAMPGDRVVARLSSSKEATFKILAEDTGRKFLRAINIQYPILEISDNTMICGKVIGSFTAE